jgi:hypothetical protein
VAAAAAATLATGPGAWATYADLVRGLSGTFSTPHNFAPGALAYLAGAPEAVVSAVQYGSAALAAAMMLAAWRFASPVGGLQATFLASQLLASPLRDHYAALLLLPTAWLLARGWTWAAVFPLAGWLALAAGPGPDSWLLAATIPLSFFACLVIVLVDGIRERGTPPGEASVAPAAPAV